MLTPNDAKKNSQNTCDPFLRDRKVRRYINPYILIALGMSISIVVVTYHFFGFKQHLIEEEKKLKQHVENLHFSNQFAQIDEAMTLTARASMQGRNREMLVRYLKNEQAMKDLLDSRFEKEVNDPESQKIILELRRTFRDLMQLEGRASGKNETPFYLTQEYLDSRKKIRNGLKKLNERILTSKDLPLKSMVTIISEFDERNKIVLAILIAFWIIFGASLILSKWAYDESRQENNQQRKILKILVQGMPYGVLAYDQNNNSILWNKTARELIPRGPDSLDGELWQEVMSNQYNYEKNVNGKILNFNAVNLKNIEGSTLGTVVLIEDVTEKRKTEEELRHELEKKAHTSKMRTLGEVAGNLAHEINTPLTTIHISIDGMERAIQKEDKESVASYMHSILQAAKRMGAIVNAFRRYSRVDGIKENPELIDLRDVLTDALEICGPDITARGLILERSIPNQPLITRCRPGPLAQAIINLMTNARDAALEVPKGWVKVSAVQSEGFVLIDVEDAGKGLSEGLDRQIFEPFFSTKPRGQGSGIGLGIVRDVAHAHGGEVLHLKKNGHTCFEIKIPVSAA